MQEYLKNIVVCAEILHVIGPMIHRRGLEDFNNTLVYGLDLVTMRTRSKEMVSPIQ